MGAAPKSMREALEESFGKAEEETGRPAEDPEESLGAAEEEDGEDPIVDDEPGDGEADDKVAGAKPIPDEADDLGDEDVPDKVAAKEKIPAPVSWKPSTRELWNKLPVAVQQEVQRREGDIAKGMQQASGYKKMAAEYHSVVQPFESLIRAQNSTPSQAITNLMTTAARLTMGTPAQKAAVISEIIQNYGVDIETLDTVLSGQEMPDSQYGPILQQLDTKLAPITDFMSRFSQTEQQQVQETSQKVTQDIQVFASDPKNSFFEDVREDMADFLEFAGKRNIPMTLKDAYDKACANHPEVSKVINQRKAARVARLSGRAGAGKRHAASGVPSSAPVGDGRSGAGSGSLRGALEAAFSEREDDGI